MTGRDICWRVVGAALTIAACTAAKVGGTEGSPLILVYFAGAILGIVLLFNGKMVMTVWRAERSGHQDTAAAIHAARVRRHRRRRDYTD